VAKPELIVNAHAIIGEGPWWDSRASLLYWLDIQGRRLHVYDPDQASDRSVTLSERPGAVVGRQSGGLLMAMEHGFAFVDPNTGAATPILNPEPDKPGNRFNDGKCDSYGRFWAGTMDDAEKERSGAFYRLDADLSCTRLFGGVGISNGFAWSPDDKYLYYIDTPTRRIDAFDFDPETGGLSNRRVAFEVPLGMGFPDGMTVDEEGMLWVALWMGWGGVFRGDYRAGSTGARVDPAAVLPHREARRSRRPHLVLRFRGQGARQALHHDGEHRRRRRGRRRSGGSAPCGRAFRLRAGPKGSRFGPFRKVN